MRADATDAHPAHPWTATGHERPVFLDEHGRRRRWVIAGGAIAGAASALWLAGLLAGPIGFTRLPLPLPHPHVLARAPIRTGVARTGAAPDAVADTARAHRYFAAARDFDLRTPTVPIRRRLAPRRGV